jgi:hypothetical protein
MVLECGIGCSYEESTLRADAGRKVNVMQLEESGVPFLVDSSWTTLDELLGGNSRAK